VSDDHDARSRHQEYFGGDQAHVHTLYAAYIAKSRTRQGVRRMANSDDANSDALDLLRGEWEREWGMKESFERRGVTVITASGVFVTLVFGFASSVTKGHHFANFTYAEKILLAVALGWFIVSGFVALSTNIPARIGTVPGEAFIEKPDRLMSLLVEALGSLRAVNREKANQLVVAALCQLVAILTLGGTVIAIVA
jgi:hypothetical protein